MYNPLTAKVFMTFLWLFHFIHVHKWNRIFHDWILNFFLQYFKTWNVVNTLLFNLHFSWIMNWQFRQHLFHFLILIFIVTIFRLLNSEYWLNRTKFPFSFLMMRPALTWISSFDKWGHDCEYFPQFNVMLYCENMLKIIKKHNIFDVFLCRPMSWFTLTTLWTAIINRNKLQYFLWTINTF